MSKHFRASLRRCGLGWSKAARLLIVSEEQIEHWWRLDVPTPEGALPCLTRLAEEDFYQRVGDGPVAWTRRGLMDWTIKILLGLITLGVWFPLLTNDPIEDRLWSIDYNIEKMRKTAENTNSAVHALR
jgi:hypothetical protein